MGPSAPNVGRLTGPEARALVRAGLWRRPTIGMADGWVQANLVILPQQYAEDFLRFCQLNPRPCPLLEVAAEGSPEPRKVAPGADLRRDVPRYRSYRRGALEAELDDIVALWQPDLVAFLLGCSFSFEAALARAGIPLRHREMGRPAPMYRTSWECHPAGPFHGPLVVTMRPVSEGLLDPVVAITGCFSLAHGSPIHIGDPRGIGIADLAHPDYGDSVPVHPGEVPVFWACGVTPQAVAQAAGIDLMITHAPGHMFITDLRDEDIADC